MFYINSFLKVVRNRVKLTPLVYQETVRFAGHSKWANIRHIKALKDGQRSQLFLRLSRQIRLAIQDGGSANPQVNTVLRSAVEDATKRNMPQATIQNILKKSKNDQQTEKLRKYIMEIRLQPRIFVVCIYYTDNLAAFKISLGTVLRKGGAKLGDAKHLFNEFGCIEATVITPTDDWLQLATDHAIECDAEDVEVINEMERRFLFYCAAQDLDKVRTKLWTKGYFIEMAEHVFVPNNTINLTPRELKTYLAFKDKLNALEGVEDIFDNINLETDEA